MEQGGDAAEEAGREADLPEQIPLLGHLESRPYTSNHEVGIDVFESINSVGKRSSNSDAVCMGVAYVQVRVERKTEHNSSSFDTSLQAYACDWSRRAGSPKLVRYDRGMHDRGLLSSILMENGVMFRPAGLGIPEQISRAARRHVQEDDDESQQGHARFGQRTEGHDSRRMLAKLPSKSMQILRSMKSRRTSQTYCIEKGCTCDRISTSWRHRTTSR